MLIGRIGEDWEDWQECWCRLAGSLYGVGDLLAINLEQSFESKDCAPYPRTCHRIAGAGRKSTRIEQCTFCYLQWHLRASRLSGPQSDRPVAKERIPRMKKLCVVMLFAMLAISCRAVGEEQAVKSGSSPSSSQAATIDLAASRIVDLSHPYDADTIFWPTEDGFKLEKEQDGINDKGFYYASNKFTTAEHGGTHIDAPRHFAQGHQTVDQIPLDRLIGPAILVDVSAKCEQNPDYLI